jgi:dihydroorotase
MKKILIKNATIVSEKTFVSDVEIIDGIITKIATEISDSSGLYTLIDAKGKILIPGIIDDQVHFREPGLTHKATIYTEAKAAVAGGVTSFMEMPNTVPSAVTIDLLEQKYAIAAQSSLANYSFYMGVTNTNADEVLKVNPNTICGIKIFMGSSTGDMLVDNPSTLERIFAEAPMLIAIHSEDDTIVKENLEKYKQQFGESMTAEFHPWIRDVNACETKTKYAIELAQKYDTRLHVLHISTEEELKYFDNSLPLSQKRITSEACVHHLYFDADDYKKQGNFIKCNPAIKEKRHKKAIFEALLADKIDVIATDHAPHTFEEKSNSFLKAPSGLPLVQHSLNVMLSFYQQGLITLEKIVEKMCHAPATLFQINKRGFIREGYHADMVLIDLEKSYLVEKSNILYQCKWSPFEGTSFKGVITHTIVSGNLVYENGIFHEEIKGQRLLFEGNRS